VTYARTLLLCVASACRFRSDLDVKKEKGFPSMGAIVVVVGVLGLGAVVGAVVVFVVLRSRRNSAPGQVNYGAGASPQHMGYPPQQPAYPPAQPPYPSAPQQGQPTPPGQAPQAPQYPNPYTQQPPHHGQ
jgi:hypothetical protein